MTIYIILGILVLLGIFFKDNKFIQFIVFFLLLGISSFRGLDVGGDTQIYEYTFYHPEHAFNTIKQTEWGWYWLNYFIYILTNDYRILLIVSNLLILIPVFYVSNKYSKFPLLSIALYVLLYHYLFSFCFIRQYIAISILFFSYPFLEKGKIWQFFLLVCIAMTFHVTASIAFFLLFIKKINISSQICFIIIIVSYLVGRLNVMPLIFNNIGYNEIKGYEVVYGENYRYTITGLLMSVYLGYIILLSDTKSLNIKIMVLGIILLNIFTFSTSISRVYWNFSIIQIIAIPNIPLKKPYLKYFTFVRFSFIIYSIFVYLQFLFNDQGKILPYTFMI
jgi:hypothetical protein